MNILDDVSSEEIEFFVIVSLYLHTVFGETLSNMFMIDIDGSFSFRLPVDVAKKRHLWSSWIDAMPIWKKSVGFKRKWKQRLSFGRLSRAKWEFQVFLFILSMFTDDVVIFIIV